MQPDLPSATDKWRKRVSLVKTMPQATLMTTFLYVVVMLLFGPRAWAQQTAEKKVEWTNLAAGIEYAEYPFGEMQTEADVLHVVRINPHRAQLVALSRANMTPTEGRLNSGAKISTSWLLSMRACMMLIS